MDRLWVDKHRPKSLDNLDYHVDLSQKLKKLAQAPDFPHILFYGPNGAGKKTRALAFLAEIYGSGVSKVKSEVKEFKISATSSTNVEVTIISSNFHIDVTPADADFYDRVVIQSLIKEVASSEQLDSKSQRPFKVVIVNEIDELKKEAQAALRRTMEKYMSRCRLILICENLGKVIQPLKSRCLLIRVPAPTEQEICSILHKIVKAEDSNFSNQILEKISNNCERNTRRAVIHLQTIKMQGKETHPNAEIHQTEWKLAIQEIAKMIFAKQAPEQLKEIRGKTYELLVNCIPGDLVIRYIMDYLLDIVQDKNMKFEIIYWASFHENRMQMGNKQILHIEAFIARIMSVIKRFNEDLENEMGE